MHYRNFAIAALALALCGATLGAPTIFAPGVISGAANDGSPSFSPDGNTLLFTRSTTWGIILESHRRNGAWSAPTIASFSGKWNDWAPEFSPDGRYVVFVEVRRGIGANLYRVSRVGSGWGTPVRLPAAVNIGRSIWKPSIVADGSIYLTFVDKGVKRIYYSRYRNGAYETAQPVSFSDGKHGDVDPEVAPDESFMVFASNGRLDGDSLDHLYISYRKAGTWSDPVPLRYQGDDANGRSTDNAPHFSHDLHTLYFSSDRMLPVHFPRTRAQAQADLTRVNVWDNSNSNAWSVPLNIVP
jgi:Tol biopolymer transport system component